MAVTPVNDITAIQNYSGSYAPSILRAITDPLSVSQDMYLIRDLTAPRNLWRYTANKGLRPIDTSVESTTKLQGKFAVRKITPQVGMKIIRVVPEELRKTFFSEQLDPKAKEYPAGFAQYFWEEQAKSIADEIEHNVFDSVNPDDVAAFNPATVYSPGTRVRFTLSANDGEEYFRCVTLTVAGESPSTAPAKWTDANAECVVKGIGTLIKEERTGGNLAGNIINTGAITSANAVTKIDGDMWAGIPEKVKRGKGGVIFHVSFNVFNKRVQALRAQKANGQYYSEEEIKALKYEIIDSDGKGIIKPCVWMNDSQLVIATVEKNLVMGTNQIADAQTFGPLVQGLHGYKTIMKTILAFQVQDLSVLFVNDQN